MVKDRKAGAEDGAGGQTQWVGKGLLPSIYLLVFCDS